MKKRLASLIIAGCICLSGAYSGTLCERPAHALQIIASVTKITIKKDVIAIGEKVQLELEWSTGAKQELFYKSSDEGILTVDSNGVVTGISDGTATVTVSHSNMGTDKTIDITVSHDAEISITYNTSELELGTKLKKYDTLHYDGKSKGYAANIINTKGNYDPAYISIADYVLPFDAEIVGIDGLYIYIAPQIDGITYLDGRTLSVGDTIDRNTHLLCYDYHINRMVLPVFLPEYYGKYIGDGTKKVKDIDHEKKTLTLESVENEISDAIPEWVPKNYSQAVELYNKYGSTHIEKDSKGIDTVCILIPENPSSVLKYEYEVSDSSVNEIYHNVFSDTQADYKFEIIVINDTRETPSKFDVSYKYNSYLQWVYSFSNNGSGKLTETDILSWAPDCITEFNNFEEKYGTVSIINGYVAFCEKWDNGANYGWNWTQTGNGKLTKCFGFSCNEMYIKNSTDKTEYCFNLCRPEMDGIVNMQWSYGRFNETPIEVIERNYEVSNNCSVLKEISNNIIKGDVNADGSFTVADIVMLQKWLLGVPDVTLFNWSSADLCEDGELNVFDLCMMKRELISQMQFDDTPVLFIDDYRISESLNGWKGESYERVITADGNRYSSPLCRCVFSSLEEHLNHIKSEGEKEEYISFKDEVVLRMISDFSKNASKYKDSKMINLKFGVEDYGQTKLSVLYKDENGNMQSLELYRFGEESAWLDNAEVQEFVKLLIEKEYIPDSDFLAYMLSNSEQSEISSDMFKLKSRYIEYGLGDTTVELNLRAFELPESCYVEEVNLYDDENHFIGTMSPCMDADIWDYLVDCHFTEECQKTFYTLTTIRCGETALPEPVRSECTVYFRNTPAP